MGESDCSVNYGNEPEIMRSFEMQLKSYDDGRKKFIIMRVGTRHGEAEFILLPEEAKSIADVCMSLVKGEEMREEYMPRTMNVPVRETSTGT